MKFLDGTAKRGARRSVPIHGYVGANGAGKTLAMVHDTLPSLAAGRRVLSNLPILDPATGEPHALWEPLRSWRQLLDARACDVLLDEAQGVINSRESSAMPVQMQTMLCQLRKLDVCLRYTAPNFARVDKLVREVTQAVTVCRGYMPAPERALRDGKAAPEGWGALSAPAPVDDDQGDELPAESGDESGRLWSVKRLFWWRTYDAMEWEQFSLQQVENIKPLATSWYWRPGRPAQNAYQTLGAVELMDHLSEAGLCVICGGKRTHRKCSCPIDHDDAPAGPVRRASAVGPAAAIHLRATATA